MYNSRILINLKINLYLFLMLTIFISCTENIVTDYELPSTLPDTDLEITDAFIYHEYNSDSTTSQIFAQLSVSSQFHFEFIDSVYIKSSPSIFDHLRLYDEIDYHENNGVFDAVIELEPSIPVDLYNFIFYASYDGKIDSVKRELDIQFYPPTTPSIEVVCMPELYTIDESETDTFYVFVSVDDLNGNHDIETVSLELKKLGGYQSGSVDGNGDCIWEDDIDLTYQFVEELYFYPNVSLNSNCVELGEEIPHNFVYFTPLVIDSYADCGPHGPISFKYIVEDKEGLSTYHEQEMVICHPGECD